MPTLAVRAYDELRQMLTVGRLAPGMQLVNRKIAEEIGMSMTPVREAVSRLASEGLVDLIPGVGAFVRTVTNDELLQLYEVREAIEPLAAAEAARRAARDEIARLRAINAESFGVIRELATVAAANANGSLNDRWLLAEQRFHQQIFTAAGNVWLTKIISDIKLLTTAFSQHRSRPDLLTLENTLTTWRSHRRLTRAIASRQPGEAAALLREHIEIGKRLVCGTVSSAS